ncbi:MAG: replication and repair protein RecF [Candidatus Saccharibacteria bacterium]|nr:replication and repair protein RecF [Candidatus Saccharibacteria bacterium]
MISDIRLQKFRSYADESFEIEDGVNIVVGPNASGKSNLLEAILMLARGSSYRAADSEVVAHEAPWARLDVHLDDGVRTLKMIREPNDRIRKEFIIDEQIVKRLTQPKTLPVVLFEPDHLRLLSGSPENRREYIDALLEQMDAHYGTLRRRYKRTLAQRNALLKQGSHYAHQLFAWNIRLSELAGQIVSARLELLGQINKDLSRLYSEMAGKQNEVRFEYQSSCLLEQYSSSLLHKLEQSQELDFLRGFTGSGPHRDDMMMWLNERPASETASRGETRSLLLVLKIIELRLLEHSRGQKPILLLDDVFSELDGARRRALTEVIGSYQTFITTTDADVVVQHFINNCNIIPLSLESEQSS